MIGNYWMKKKHMVGWEKNVICKTKNNKQKKKKPNKRDKVSQQVKNT